MRDLLPEGRPPLILAPMQDVTDLPFLKVIKHYGGADFYVTEYFRVHCTSKLSPWILRSIDENPTGRPIFAQMIGNDIENLVRSALELLKHPVAGIDLNLGCPAPTVYKKCAGGGLLRKPSQIDRILGALREAIQGRFTVKTRVGFESETEFESLLQIFAKHEIDALTIHGRTVKGRYQTPVYTTPIRAAAERLSCPVIANGNVVDVRTGRALLQQSHATGLMIGRGAIRNPWIFEQLRANFAGTRPPSPTRRDLFAYLRRLWDETASHQKHFDPLKHTQKMKKYAVYVAQGLDPELEYWLRRAKDEQEFFSSCKQHLDDSDPLPELPPNNSKLFCGFNQLLIPHKASPSET